MDPLSDLHLGAARCSGPDGARRRLRTRAGVYAFAAVLVAMVALAVVSRIAIGRSLERSLRDASPAPATVRAEDLRPVSGLAVLPAAATRSGRVAAGR